MGTKLSGTNIFIDLKKYVFLLVYRKAGTQSNFDFLITVLFIFSLKTAHKRNTIGKKHT